MDIFPFFNSVWWDVNKDNILHIVDAIVFLLFLISVLYLLFFAIMSTIKWKQKYEEAKKCHHFLIIFFARTNDDNNLLRSISEFLKQNYPRANYNIVVGYSELNNHTIEQLSNAGITLYQLEKGYHIGHSLKAILSNITHKKYDMALLFDANNIVSTDYIKRINEAFYSGCMAIQSHRVPIEIRSLSDRINAFSEGINNSIFRKGHVQLGFSSALNSSGIALDYKWLMENLHSLPEDDIIKKLETTLLKQNIYIDYMNNVYTFLSESTSKENIQYERSKWQKDKYVNLFKELPKLPIFFFQGNWDYCDKLLQWAIPSRFILTFLIALITCITFLYDWNISIKWFILLIILLFTYAIAAPDKLNKEELKS